jgi:hypothetical protein
MTRRDEEEGDSEDDWLVDDGAGYVEREGKGKQGRRHHLDDEQMEDLLAVFPEELEEPEEERGYREQRGKEGDRCGALRSPEWDIISLLEGLTEEVVLSCLDPTGRSRLREACSWSLRC